MIAQQILASLLASATATRRSGFLARNAAIESARGPLRLPAKRSTAVEPTTSNLRIYRLPCLVIAPSLALPPLEFCLGVSPSQEPEPSREVASRLEHARIGDARCDRRGGQRADAGYAVKQTAGLAAGAGLGDFTLHDVD